MMRSFLFPLAFAITLLGSAQSIAGRWTTVDDNTGKPRSVVEITVQNGVANGRIVELMDKGRQNAICDKCPDDRKDRPITGLEIIRGMKADGDEWSDGTILDPESGKVYDCKLWVEDGKLMVRGYVAFFFRTQTWVR
jgi:uncharacterized protein (DUF2147 family)